MSKKERKNFVIVEWVLDKCKRNKCTSALSSHLLSSWYDIVPSLSSYLETSVLDLTCHRC